MIFGYNKFGVTVREIITRLAASEIRPTVDSGHLLLELLAADTALLVILGLDIATCSERVAITNVCEADADDFSVNVRRAMQLAEIEAWRDNGGLINSRHLLQGLLQDQSSRAALALKALGVDAAKAAQMLALKSGNSPPTDVPAETWLVDLVALAHAGKLDPLIGRDAELLRLMQVLSRRRKNNPVLIGAAGVGKTALVEGLALLAANGALHPRLNIQKIYSLDLAALIAGTKYRGEFEARLKQVLQLVAGWPEYVLFIDEIHMLMGAGGAESALDASNILKPALSRGELRCIGATTPTEYQQYIEKDTAFARRFQAITVVEPDTAAVRQILSGLRSLYTEHHGVQVSDEMLCYVTESARKYVHERYFPDKALDLLDEALAKASLSALNAAESCLTKEHVVAVLHQWTGLPPDIFTAGYAQRLADLELFLKDSVFGREPSMTHLLNVLKQRYASHKDGCNAILLLGPPACGKTLLVDLMAQKLFDNCNVTELELAAYGEKHSLNGLMGANPGYAGYGEKPFLSRVLQDCNNGMLVIRNFRQAHVSVQELFSGLCQNGKVTDGAGGEIRAGNLFYVFIEETGATDLTVLTTLSKKIKAQIIELQPLEHSNFEIEMLC